MSITPLGGLLDALELAGTFSFAISGATVAIQRRLDIFGMAVLAYVTAVAGGIARDLIIGAVPPTAFRGWHTLALSVGAAVLTFFAAPLIQRLQYSAQLFDAAGLGIFAVTGMQKALHCGIDPVMAGTLGLLTGIGGGILRDILAARQPLVLSTDFYASAAKMAIVVVLAAHAAGVQTEPTSFAAVALCAVIMSTGSSGIVFPRNAVEAAPTRAAEPALGYDDLVIDNASIIRRRSCGRDSMR